LRAEHLVSRRRYRIAIHVEDSALGIEQGHEIRQVFQHGPKTLLFFFKSQSGLLPLGHFAQHPHHAHQAAQLIHGELRADLGPNDLAVLAHQGHLQDALRTPRRSFAQRHRQVFGDDPLHNLHRLGCEQCLGGQLHDLGHRVAQHPFYRGRDERQPPVLYKLPRINVIARLGRQGHSEWISQAQDEQHVHQMFGHHVVAALRFTQPLDGLFGLEQFAHRDENDVAIAESACRRPGLRFDEHVVSPLQGQRAALRRRFRTQSGDQLLDLASRLRRGISRRSTCGERSG